MKLYKATQFEDVRCFTTVKVIEELPSWQMFGPQGQEVLEIIERGKQLTSYEMERLLTARDASRDATWVEAYKAVWAEACFSKRNVAWGEVCQHAKGVVKDTALTYLVRDKITEEQFDICVRPWNPVIP